jgi:hypothetical protein
LANDLLRDIRELDRKLADLNRRLGAAVFEQGTTLTEHGGIGTLLAARVLAHTGSVDRFPTEGRYASYAGVAPIEVASGVHSSSTLPRWEPTTELRLAPDRASADPTQPRRRRRLLPTETGRREDSPGSHAMPEETHRQQDLPSAAVRPTRRDDQPRSNPPLDTASPPPQRSRGLT